MAKFASPAIRATMEGYEIHGETLMGRQMANRGFLEALIHYGELEALHAYDPQPDNVRPVLERLTAALGANMPVCMVDTLEELAEVGGLELRDPSLAGAARERSFVGAKAYSLTGVTHALADPWAAHVIAALVGAPVQPWDALICTSRAVAAMVQETLKMEEARLAERLQAKRFPRPMLPIIPLGVDPARVAPREEYRSAWRERLGIADKEVAVLFMGRLSRHGKAHPLPMMMALGRAAQTQANPLHLILSGWWMHPPEEAIWREAAAAACPQVQLHVLDGRQEAVRREIWSAADCFAFLVDNVQESFGLAPVEAMAAGLPVVASDWDGLRDTVRHGIDGFLIPTTMAPPGDGVDIARRLATRKINYGGFLALTARMTALDIRAAGEAFAALAADARLRQRMGAAGRARVRETFDWSVVIPQYRALWKEQQAVRMASKSAEDLRPDPRHLDPTRAYAAWPTEPFDLAGELRPDPAAIDDLNALQRFTAPSHPNDLSEPVLAELLAVLQQLGAATGHELINTLEPALRNAGKRALIWLLRTGLVMHTNRDYSYDAAYTISREMTR